VALACDTLFAAAYGELHRLAHARLRDGGRNTVLDTTCLVHESYLRFVRAGELRAEDRRAFFAYELGSQKQSLTTGGYGSNSGLGRFPISPSIGRVEQLESLSPKDLIPFQGIGPNARLWESLQSRCSEAAGRVGQRIRCRITTTHARSKFSCATLSRHLELRGRFGATVRERWHRSVLPSPRDA
jgi:hypothetical protein